MKKDAKKIIVLVGGDTGGPVSPLLALAETMKRKMPKSHFVFVGTKRGVERHMAKKAGIPFVPVAAAKLRRYASIRNIFIPLILLTGLVQSYRILNALQPTCVVGAGGFVQVPVMWAAWLLGIPVFLHQQDVLPGLANKLCAPMARRITVSFAESVQDFPHGWLLTTLHHAATDRVVWTGNPARALHLPPQEKAVRAFGLDPEYPTLLVMGGGSGALSLNSLVVANLRQLTRFFNVLHLTGTGKKSSLPPMDRYKAIEFLDDMGQAYAAATMVMCRAGLATITELARAKKPVLQVAIPGTHQEANAWYLSEREAVLALDQQVLTSQNLVTLLHSLLFDHRLQQQLGRNLHKLFPEDANERVYEVIHGALGRT